MVYINVLIETINFQNSRKKTNPFSPRAISHRVMMATTTIRLTGTRETCVGQAVLIMVKNTPIDQRYFVKFSIYELSKLLLHPMLGASLTIRCNPLRFIVM